MTLTQQVYTQALLLAGDLEPRQEELLKLLCASVVSSLSGRLREGIRPEDCLTDFEAQLRQKPDAAVFTHVSNVFGHILPVEEMAKLCRQYRIPG